jgi:glycosyltransferase involved in cell wall biosynthesis
VPADVADATRRSDRVWPQRLGIYVDGPYALVAGPDRPLVASDAADYPFLTFACEVGAKFERRVIFARVHATDLGDRVPLPPDVDVVSLPDYGDLRHVRGVARAARGTVRAFWAGLGGVDVVWVFGPHPFGLVLAVLALVRRKRVVLGVRQDSLVYFDTRLPARGRTLARLAVRAVDVAFRALGRVTAATVVGSELANRFGGASPRVLAMTVSLMRDSDVAAAPQRHDWSGTIELLTVGRIDREKNPNLLIDALAQLDRSDPKRYRITWIGTGPMEGNVVARASELGIRDRVTLAGFVPFGPTLLDSYRRAHIFVHVSLTEGVPAVLMEAMASGIPVVATAVGGVSAALDHGRAGLLVPPSDRDALATAIVRLAGDAGLRKRLTAHALALARAHTIDTESARVAAFLVDGRVGA